MTNDISSGKTTAIIQRSSLEPIASHKCEETRDAHSLKTSIKEYAISFFGTMQTAIKQTFNAIVEKGASRFFPKFHALLICQRVQKEIQSLIKHIEIALFQLENQDKKLNKELIDAQETYVKFCQGLRENEKNLCDLEARLKGFSNKQASLSSDINKLNIEMKNIERRIDEEKIKIEDARLDNIPILGIFIGIIGGLSTKRYKRMIPFHSAIAALISMIKGEKENCLRRLNEKIKERDDLNKQHYSISDEIRVKKEAIDYVNREISRLNTEVSLKDSEIKQFGQNLTSLRNIYLSLKTQSEKCTFLEKDIEVFKECIEDLLQTYSKADFYDEVKNIQKSFDQLNIMNIEEVKILL